ncbi:uncharacterized protein LOC126555056 [Aphis gossypii]|uniref:uncharacterized protein LOC126555056 n=1 Tax=Aphis gossypii TaxID=80765 RepID=UPI002158D34E|nr:uncharacterized protein LOC126555056 [Aphis gossypii]
MEERAMWQLLEKLQTWAKNEDCRYKESSKQFHVLKPKPTHDEGHSVNQEGMPKSIPQIQQMAPATDYVNFQADSQHQQTVESPSTSASLETNQLSTEEPINVINDVDPNFDKMSW